jgi:hypothetical protein
MENHEVPLKGTAPQNPHWEDDMNTIQAANWLRTFYSRPGAEETPGDDLGTTYAICGGVILAAVLTATRSPERLAELTGLPVAFVAVVIANLDHSRTWDSYHFHRLCHVLRTGIDQFEAVDQALHALLEEFWNHSKLPGATEILPALRGTSLLFGKQQAWIHQEFLEELIGPELVYGGSLK